MTASFLIPVDPQASRRTRESLQKIAKVLNDMLRSGQIVEGADGTFSVNTIAGYVPSGRSLTINGVTQDLSANRTFTITTITGNAGSATVLQTGRSINGVVFNGSANITVPAAGSTLTDTVTVAKGGTGGTSYSGFLFGNGTSAMTAIASTGSGNVVLASSPVLVTPNLGTPSTLVGTNISGTASGFTVGTANASPASGLTGATMASNVLVSSMTATGTLAKASVSGSLGGVVISTCLVSTGTLTLVDNNGYGIDVYKVATGVQIDPRGGTAFLSLGNTGVPTYLSGLWHVDISSGDWVPGNQAFGLQGTFRPGVTQTTVNGSTSGTAVFSQPIGGTAYKVVAIYFNALLGTASYTFPTAFTNTPSVVATNDVAAGVVTSRSTTAVTVTGATSTGSLLLVGY